MIVTNTSIAMASGHRLEQKESRTETLRIWVDPPAKASADKVTLSPQAKEASLSDPEERVGDSPKLFLIRALIEAMTGRKIRLLTAADLQTTARGELEISRQERSVSSQGQQRAGWGVRYDFAESHTETENTTFQADGIVKTADGKVIPFSLDVRMARSFSSDTSFSLRAGDALIDPLVVNFNGPAALLTDQTFSFDLNADGSDETLPFLQEGSGFLTLDVDGDGRINNGRELFGPATGDGFAELARYDEDKNGWIDERDWVYKNLAIRTKAADGTDIVMGLKAGGVGAIFTGYADTSFALKDDMNSVRGQIRRTGVYLSEDGRAGSIQQVDLSV